MPSNLRARPIEGYITDNSGNVRRNAIITIKEPTPSGSNVVDTVNSDDDGYFISSPLKNGLYDVYESGVRTLRYYNPANPDVIQSYKKVSDNVPTGLIDFSTLLTTGEMNNYKYYIQIESDNVNVTTYGHIFPIYDVEISLTNILNDTGFGKIDNFHNLGINSRLTYTRFDVEFFNPLTSSSSQHRRMRWAGVPAIRFFTDSKLVIPLDYYSLVCNSPSWMLSLIPSTALTWISYGGTGEVIKITQDKTTPDADRISVQFTKGDIMELRFDTKAAVSNYTGRLWAIYYDVQTVGSNDELYARVWKSDNATDNPAGSTPVDSIYSGSGGGGSDTGGVISIKKHNGFYEAIENISVSTSEKFTVTENMYAQDRSYSGIYGSSPTYSELYTYENS